MSGVRQLRRAAVPYAIAAIVVTEFGPWPNAPVAVPWIVFVFGTLYAAFFLALEAARLPWAPLFLADAPLADPAAEQ